MTVRETDTIDYIYLEEENHAPVLVVSDPMGWKPQEEEAHLDLLMEKLNTQIAFVGSGEIAKVWPEHGEDDPVWVEVAAQCALSPKAEAFYHQAGRMMADANINLRFMLLY